MKYLILRSSSYFVVEQFREVIELFLEKLFKTLGSCEFPAALLLLSVCRQQ